MCMCDYFLLIRGNIIFFGTGRDYFPLQITYISLYYLHVTPII